MQSKPTSFTTVKIHVILWFWIASLGVLANSPLNEIFETHFSLRLSIKVRELLHLAPSLDEKIKILAYDDSSAGFLQTPDLTLADWGAALAALGQARPAQIIIPKTFSIPFDPQGKRDRFINLVGLMPNSPVVGLDIRARRMPFKEPLPAKFAGYSQSIIPLSGQSDFLGAKVNRATVLLALNPADCRTCIVYGPHFSLWNAFQKYGHIAFNFDGTFTPFHRIQDGTILPHIGLWAAAKKEIKDEQIFLNGKRLPVDRDGRVIVNLPSLAELKDHTTSLYPSVTAGRLSKPVSGVSPGDIVIISPASFGGSELITTPIGKIPKSYIVVAIVNSAMTGRWIMRLPYVEILSIVLTWLGFFVGLKFMERRVSLLLIAESCVVLTGVLTLLVAARIHVPIHMAALAVLGGTVIARTLHVSEFSKQLREYLPDSKKRPTVKEFAMPEKVPTWDNYFIAAHHQASPAGNTDWYGFAQSGSGNLCHFILCDIHVNGKQSSVGVSACKALFNFILEEQPEIVGKVDFICEFSKMLNRLLIKQGGGSSLLSFIGVTFEPGSGLLHFIGAGHPAPLGVFRQTDGGFKSDFLRTSTVPLGQREDAQFVMQTRTFNNGDELIIYSDGFRDKKSFAALQRFMESRSHAPGSDPRNVFAGVFGAKSGAIELKEQDDLSVVWFRAAA